MLHSVERTDDNVVLLRYKYKEGFQTKAMATGDRHHDNPKSLNYFERAHLEEAKANGWPVLDIGDLFCAMQGKYDRRKSKEDVRPINNKDDYLDNLVDTAAEFYEPYREQFVAVCKGNHEDSIKKHNEVDLMRQLTNRLGINYLGWAGYVKFMFEHEGGGKVQSFVAKLHHGFGAGGYASRGTTQINQISVYNGDVDFVIMGHTHSPYVVPIGQEYVKGNHKHGKRTQFHLRVPTYKEEFQKGNSGWHISNGQPPKPIGRAFLEFRVQNNVIIPNISLDIIPPALSSKVSDPYLLKEEFRKVLAAQK